ncbi:MAG: hypothetical protein ACRC2J_14110 [Microcoleaceae cyanobacterium]
MSPMKEQQTTNPTNQTAKTNTHHKTPHPFWLALALTGIIVLEVNPQLVEMAIANPGKINIIDTMPSLSQRQILIPNNFTISQLNTSSTPNQSLPRAIAEAVRQDLFRKTGIPTDQVQIKEASTAQWPNACLGLAKSGEMCAEIIVPGWRIVLSDGKQTWIYRTDNQGNRMRIENRE